MGLMLDTVGKIIARYLQKEVPGYEPFTPSDPERLRDLIQPGDVLLIEGNNRISGIIKYLTQSTWSHSALYVGPVDGATEPDGEPHVLIEANVGEGVTSAPLSKYYPYHTRLCRPVGLSYEDRTTVCRYAINRIGFGYDTKNIVDLMRYLIPLPVPQRWRRRMIAFGSGDPTKIICSALIAQAFGAVIDRAPVPMHGKVSRILHDGTGVFRGVPSPIEATRYHSLTALPETIPAVLAVNARTEDGVVMGLRHRELPIHGVQFHPESIETREGHRLLRNFLELLPHRMAA